VNNFLAKLSAANEQQKKTMAKANYLNRPMLYLKCRNLMSNSFSIFPKGQKRDLK